MGRIAGWRKIKELKKYPYTKLWIRKRDNAYVKYTHTFKEVFNINIYLNTNPNLNRTTFQKQFRTKAQALKFASRYMRTHPRG